MKRRLGGAFGVAVVLLALWTVVVEPARLVVVERTLVLPGWRGAPLRVAVLSDLHVGSPRNGPPRLDALVAVVNGQRPDLVVLLGDYVIQGVWGGRFVEPEDIARGLRPLSAPLGVIAVLGNHDWWLDGERVRTALTHVGIRVLENEWLEVRRPGGGFRVAGLADAWTRSIDMARAVPQDDSWEPVLLLTHHPDVFPTVPASVTLTLAGHTHGGQVRLPLIGAPVVPSQFGQRYARGLIVEEGRSLFVTSGVGTSILPVRFRVPPEVVLLTLTAAPAP